MLGDEYIPHDTKNKWDDWRNQWCYIIIYLHKWLLLPSGQA